MKTSEITAIFDADLARVWEAVTNNADCGWRSDLSGIEITGENTFTEFANNGFPTYFTIEPLNTRGLLVFIVFALLACSVFWALRRFGLWILEKLLHRKSKRNQSPS